MKNLSLKRTCRLAKSRIQYWRRVTEKPTRWPWSLDHLTASERYQVVVQMADELMHGRAETQHALERLADLLLCVVGSDTVKIGTGLGSDTAVLFLFN